MNKRLVATLLTLITVLASTSAAAREALMIGAAASLEDALSTVGDALAQETKMRYQWNFAASSVLVRQLAAGAPLDMIMTADEATMDQLAARGLIDPTSRRDFVANELVLIVPRQAAGTRGPDRRPRTLADLPQVARLALAYEAVPAGRYARLLLAREGLLPALQEHIVGAPSVRATLALVAHGAADAGLVYASDLRAAGAGELVEARQRFGRTSGLAIRYPLALTKSCRDRQAALTLSRYLQTPAARRVLVDYGFLPLEAP